MLFKQNLLRQVSPRLRHAVLCLPAKTNTDLIISLVKKSEKFDKLDASVQLKMRINGSPDKALTSQVVKICEDISQSKPKWYTFKGGVFSLVVEKVEVAKKPETVETKEDQKPESKKSENTTK